MNTPAPCQHRTTIRPHLHSDRVTCLDCGERVEKTGAFFAVEAVIVPSEDAPPEELNLVGSPERALAYTAPTFAGMMIACRVAEYAFPRESPLYGRTLILTAAPQTAEKKE